MADIYLRTHVRLKNLVDQPYISGNGPLSGLVHCLDCNTTHNRWEHCRCKDSFIIPAANMMVQSMAAHREMSDLHRRLMKDPKVKQLSNDEYISTSDYTEIEQRMIDMFDNCEKLQKFEEALINLKSSLNLVEAAFPGMNKACVNNVIPRFEIEWAILFSRAERDQGWVSFCYIRKTPVKYDFWDLFDGSEDES